MQKKSTKESTGKKKNWVLLRDSVLFYVNWDYIEDYFWENGLESYKKGVIRGTIIKDNVGKEV